MTIIKLIQQDIRSHNCFMTQERLDQMTPLELLRNAHPLYRMEYANILYKQGIITDEERRQANTSYKLLGTPLKEDFE